MALKRARKPKKPQQLEDVFAENEHDTPGIREIQPEVEPDETLGSTNDAFAGILDVPIQTLDPPSHPPGPSGSVDEYIRNQVLEEMYGTTNPSEYDKV